MLRVVNYLLVDDAISMLIKVAWFFTKHLTESKQLVLVLLGGLSWNRWTFGTEIVNKGECAPGSI